MDRKESGTMQRWMGPISVAACAMWLTLVAPAANGAALYGCGELYSAEQFGPFDYRSIPAQPKRLVEGAHFTPTVEGLKRGKSSSLGGDIDYTLRAIPNHPRALMAMSRLGMRLKTERPVGNTHSIECYFERAIRFVPDDPMPHLLYAIYLKDRKRIADANQELANAEKLRGDVSNYDFDYNLGLVYFDVGNYEKSALHAKRAYELGASLPGLKKKLESVGKWPK